MREIKFRMWNPETKVMVDLYKITPLAVHPDLLKENLDGLFIPFKENYPLMQFTGLLDKNGKEIYQFDLWKLGDEIYLIVWKEGDWQTGWKKLAGDNYTDIGKDNAKSGLIIGNLLENPDLLNVPSCSENKKDE